MGSPGMPSLSRSLCLLLSSLLCLSSAPPVYAGGEAPPYARVFELAFQRGWRVTIDDALPGEPARLVEMGFYIFDAGRLRLPSGRITACDPFVGIDRPPFAVALPKGEYPVRLALIEGTFGDGRVAFARVDFSSAPVVRWEMAVSEGQNPVVLKDDSYFGYPVDAGTGSFVDADAAQAAAARMKGDESWSQSWIDAGTSDSKIKGVPRFFLAVDAGPGNIIMFQSGWGDGFYASWFGYDADGKVAALVTDFQSVDWSKAKW